MRSATEKSKLAGTWHILNMNGWDADYINMEVQAYIHIGKNGIGHSHHAPPVRAGL